MEHNAIEIIEELEDEPKEIKITNVGGKEVKPKKTTKKKAVK